LFESTLLTERNASEMLSTVAIDIACAICSSDNPNNLPVPAAVEIASWIADVNPILHVQDRHHGVEPATLDLQPNSKRCDYEYLA